MFLNKFQRAALGLLATTEYYVNPDTGTAYVFKHVPKVTKTVYRQTLEILQKEGLVEVDPTTSKVLLTADGRRIAIALGFLKPPRRKE